MDDHPARTKKARSGSDQVVPPPSASASSGDGFSRLLDEVMSLRHALEQAKQDVERHRADATRAVGERDVLELRVRTLEDEVNQVKIKLSEKSKAVRASSAWVFRRSRCGSQLRSLADVGL